jgi:hypothetical protein
MEVRRTIACLIVLTAVFFAGFVSGAPNENTGCKNAHTKVETPIGPSEQTKDEPADSTKAADWYTPKWYTAFKRPDGMLVVVGILTLLAIAWQSRETARSAKAAQDNTRLQIAALRQWVNIQGFRDSVDPRFTPTGTELDLKFFFEITNPTKMPLTLEWYVISINTTKYSSRLNVTLAPNQVHGLGALIRYTDAVRDKYLRDGYDITITGVIAYTDALKDFQKQRFGYLHKCRPTGGETLNYKGPLPDEDIEKEESGDS